MPATPRGAMTPARKHRIWLAYDGRCGMCGAAVPETGPGVVYDHDLQLWMGGPEADANVAPLCADPCNQRKTMADAGVRATTKRQQKMAPGVPRPPSRMRSRGFQTKLRRTFSGKVVPR